MREVLLRGLARGDVAQERIEDHPVFGLERSDGQLDGKLVPVATYCRQFQPLAQQPQLACLQRALDAFAMRLTLAFRDDRIGQLAAQYFLPGPAEDLFRLRIPVRDESASIDGDESVASRFENLSGLALACFQCGVSGLAIGDIAR